MKVKVIWTAEHNPDLVSRLVMRFQKTPYSHVAILFDGEKGGKHIVHAIGKGVCMQWQSEYLFDHDIVASKEVELECSEDMFRGYVLGAEGKEYSTSQLLLIALGIKCLRNGGAKTICSEFVGGVIRLFTSHKLTGHPDFWTPKYLFEVLKPEITEKGKL